MDTNLVVFDKFRAELKEFKEKNASLFFDYSTPQGNKEARSHIYKIRQSRAALEKARKDAKAESLEYGRKVDATAKEITEELDAMIEVHQKPIDEIEEKEAKRIAEIELRVTALTPLISTDIGSDALKATLEQIQSTVVDESFMEYQQAAQSAKDTSIDQLSKLLADIEKREAEQKELAEFRKAADERAKKDREEAIAKEAAERATREAEAKAKAEAEAAARKVAQEKLDAEAREAELIRQKKEAEEKAARAVEEERQRAEKEAADKAAADAKREADKKHQNDIHSAIIKACGELGIHDSLANSLITSIRSGTIPHMKIVY